MRQKRPEPIRLSPLVRKRISVRQVQITREIAGGHAYRLEARLKTPWMIGLQALRPRHEPARAQRSLQEDTHRKAQLVRLVGEEADSRLVHLIPDGLSPPACPFQRCRGSSARHSSADEKRWTRHFFSGCRTDGKKGLGQPAGVRQRARQKLRRLSFRGSAGRRDEDRYARRVRHEKGYRLPVRRDGRRGWARQQHDCQRSQCATEEDAVSP